MRFLADMGISMRTVRWLKQAGHDAVHLGEQGLQRLPDDEILVKARIEDRIVTMFHPEGGQSLRNDRDIVGSWEIALLRSQ